MQKNIQLLLSLALFTLPIQTIWSNEPPLPINQPQAIHNQAFQDMLFVELKTSLKTLSFTLQNMALAINNNQIRAIKKQNATPILMQLQQLVASIEQTIIATVTPETNARLLNFTGSILLFLQDAMDKNFKNVAFDPDMFMKRSTPHEIDNEQLHEQLEAIQTTINDLQKKSETVGLSFYNRWFRSLETINKKTKLTKIIGYSALGALAVTSMIYFAKSSWMKEYLEGTTIGDKIILPCKEWLGDSVNTKDASITGNNVDDEPIEGSGTNLERIFGDKGLGIITFQIGAILSASMLKEPLEKLGRKWMMSTTKKYKKILAWLRGGPIEYDFSEIHEVEAKATFADVIGNEEIKQQLQPIIEYILDHKNWDRSGTPPQTGILFVGQTRVGKTFMAEAVAGEIKNRSDERVRMVELNAAELKKEPGITAIFELAQEIAKESGPLILVIDEIDCGGFKRTGDGADNAALSELLTALSNINRLKEQKIVVFACTNRKEDIDDALLASGRFGTHIYFHLPTYADRLTFLQRELAKRTIILSMEYIESLARKTEGHSFDTLNGIITIALQQAKIRQESVTIQDFERAYLKAVLKINVAEPTIPDEEQQLVAIHQAGIVLARILLETKHKVLRATTLSVSPDLYEQDKQKNKQKLAAYRKQYGYVYTLKPKDSAGFTTHKDKINEVKAELAGFAAEAIVNGQTSYDYNKHAYNKALEKAQNIVFKNINQEQLPKAVIQTKLNEAYELMKQCEQEIAELLNENQDQLLSLANALHEKRLLDYEDIKAILEESSADDEDELDQEIDLDAFLDDDHEVELNALDQEEKAVA